MPTDDMSFHCRICKDHLVLEIEADNNHGSGADYQTVPDDLKLGCGCHYHWQCFLDEACAVAISLKCPSCQASLQVDGQGPSTTNYFPPIASGSTIPVRYVNEGGIEDNLDILPTIIEEAYLSAHPEARPARAYHVMCAEGDVAGIVEMLKDLEEESGGDVVQLGHLLRYRDPLAGGVTGLHLAVQSGQEDVVWLLLWLASGVPTDVFPDNTRQVAHLLQIQRLDTTGDDIRGLCNDAGQSAQDVAKTQAARWGALLGAGLLQI